MHFENHVLPDGRRLQREPEYGFLKVIPRPSAEELSNYYGNRYRPPVRPHDPAGRAAIVEGLHPIPGRVLDIGCGQAEILEVLVQKGWTAVGIEPSSTDAGIARSKGVEVVPEMLTPEVVARLGVFDAVLLVHVLEHLPEPEAMLKLVHGLLRPGGIFYCEVPNDFNLFQEVAVETQGLRPWWIVLPDHLNYFSISSLSHFIGGHGFEVCLKTTDFPVELFLLWGDIYLDNPAAARDMHSRRCRFEQVLREAGQSEFLARFYEKLAELEVGRQAIVGARRI